MRLSSPAGRLKTRALACNSPVFSALHSPLPSPSPLLRFSISHAQLLHMSSRLLRAAPRRAVASLASPSPPALSGRAAAESSEPQSRRSHVTASGLTKSTTPSMPLARRHHPGASDAKSGGWRTRFGSHGSCTATHTTTMRRPPRCRYSNAILVTPSCSVLCHHTAIAPAIHAEAPIANACSLHWCRAVLVPLLMLRFLPPHFPKSCIISSPNRWILRSHPYRQSLFDADWELASTCLARAIGRADPRSSQWVDTDRKWPD